VTGVDSTRKLSMLRSLGADQVIDYTQEDFTQSGGRYDLIFDVPGNHPFSACRRALTPSGRYVLIGHEHFGASGKRVFGILPHFFTLIFLSLFVKQLRLGRSSIPSKQDAVAVFRELLEAGKITPIIDSTYPLSRAREALRHMIDDEPRGKVILTPAEAA
jgi:NADPH:quinone reductase-like Zn-dependent oxidoreductase